MVDLSEGRGKGQWEKRGDRVYVTCPNCEAIGFLDHDIKSDGTVAPSLCCPRVCGFHEFIRLKGWKS